MNSCRSLVFKAFATSCIVSSLAYASPPPAPICNAPSTGSFSNNTAVAIPDIAVATSTVTVSGLPTYLWDVDLTTFITHPFSSDLDITLTSPQGTVVTISSDNGGGNDNVFNGTLWDDSANPGGEIPHPSNGNSGLVTDSLYSNNVLKTPLVPEEPLAAFEGENPNGTWTLRVSDDSAIDTGSLAKWSLDFTAFPAATLINKNIFVFANTTPLAIPDNSSSVTSAISVSGMEGKICGINVKLNIPHTFTGDIQAALISPSGRIASISTNSGGSPDNVFTGTLFGIDLDPGNQVPFPSNVFAASNLCTDTVYTNNILKTQVTPEESFQTLYGENPNGEWKLRVADTRAGDTGTLTQWDLEVTSCQEAAPDTDNDGTINCFESCPSDPGKLIPGVCGCGTPDIDSDLDGVLNCLDLCPTDPAKTSPGGCGCGVAETDSDGDGVLNCLDACPANGALSTLGVCGCDTPIDANANGAPECNSTAEIGVRIKTVQSALKKLKLSDRNAKGQKQLRASIKSLVNDLASFTQSNASSVIVSSSSVNVNSLSSKVKSLTSKVLKSGSTSKDLANLKKALSNFAKGLKN